jgi:uncharacterized repeat protein (TIGR03987 family)
MLAAAIVFMCLALTFYSCGVWGEKLRGTLMGRHLIFFWAGLVCDTTGTAVMSRIAGSFELNFHGVTGLIAILLMIFHALWATLTMLRGSEKSRRNFHRFSLPVWFIWLVPFFSGMIFAMTK